MKLEGKLEARRCTFTNNAVGKTSLYSAGVITMVGATSEAILTDCTFKDNTSPGSAGAFMAEGASVVSMTRRVMRRKAELRILPPPPAPAAACMPIPLSKS